jgi:hypothetical protein
VRKSDHPYISAHVTSVSFSPICHFLPYRPECRCPGSARLRYAPCASHATDLTGASGFIYFFSISTVSQRTSPASWSNCQRGYYRRSTLVSSLSASSATRLRFLFLPRFPIRLPGGHPAQETTELVEQPSQPATSMCWHRRPRRDPTEGFNVRSF